MKAEAKKIRKALIDLNWTVRGLSKAIEKSETWTSLAIHGRTESKNTRNLITQALNERAKKRGKPEIEIWSDNVEDEEAA